MKIGVAHQNIPTILRFLPCRQIPPRRAARPCRPRPAHPRPVTPSTNRPDCVHARLTASLRLPAITQPVAALAERNDCTMKSLSFKRPMWLLSALAIVAAGCQTVPTDPVNIPQDPAPAPATPSAAPAPTLAVDSKVQAATRSLEPFDDGVARTVAAVTDKSNIPVEFVQDEIMVETSDMQALDGLVKRLNGVLLNTFDPAQYGMIGDKVFLLRVNAPPADLAGASADLARLNPKAASQLRVSSDAGADLIAAAAHEAAGGLTVAINFLAHDASARDRNVREAGSGMNLVSFDGSYSEKYDPNPFNWSYMKVGGPQNFGVAEAWSILDRAGKLGNKVKIAIVDGGFADSTEYPPEREHNNASLTGADPRGPNEVQCSGGSSCPWHGLNVVETCMGRMDNGLGAAGPAGPVARCLTIRRSSDIFNNLHAVGAALLSGANIINMSFCSRVPASLSWSCIPFSEATGRAHAAGKLIFASAGNDNADIDSEDCFIECWEDAWFTPAENDGVIAVGSMDLGSRYRRPDSNYGGEELDIWGPGFVWVGPDPRTPSVHSFGATSAASPFVAGVAALIWAANPGLSNNDVERILMDTCNRGQDGQCHRWPNAAAAVIRALGNTPPELSNVSVRRDGFTGRALTFSCDARDAEDGVPNVVWTSDRVGVIGTGTFFGRSDLPYGRHVFTCTATDRGGVQLRETVTFDLVNAPPRVSIEQPMDGAHYYAGQIAYFECYSYDLEASSRLPENALSWSSSLDGFIGNGSQVQGVLRATGTHRITLTGRDADGLSSQASIGVVVDPPPPDGVPPTAFIYTFDYNPNRLQREPDTDRVYVDLVLAGVGNDVEDGPLPGSALTWTFESATCRRASTAAAAEDSESR